jgi:hypothetical protein
MFVKKALKVIEDLKIEDVCVYKSSNKRVKKKWGVDLNQAGGWDGASGIGNGTTPDEAFAAAVKDLKKEIAKNEENSE